MQVSTGPITRRRKEIRAGLIALGAPIVLVGGWALLAPHGWYGTFPGGGRHWVSALGPFDEHLVRDFGGTYLGLGLLLLFAALALDRLLVQAVLGASLVFQVPHFIFHAANTGPLTASDNALNLALLGVGLVLTVALLVMTFRPHAAVQPTAIEGGIGYGTR